MLHVSIHMDDLIRKLSSYAKLSRIDHGVMASLAVVAGAFSVENTLQSISNSPLLLAVTSVLFVEMSLFSSNDIFNIKEDKINNPTRPIVAGELSTREAVAFTFITGLIAVLTSAMVNTACLVVIIVALVVGNLYNSYFKRHAFFGNIIVSGLTSFTFPYGAISIAGTLTEKSLLFFMIAFLANLGREIAKGIRDLEGDTRVGICTLPCEIGTNNAGKLAGIFMLMAVALSFYGANYVKTKPVYLVLILVTDAIFTCVAVKLIHNPSTQTAEKARKLTLPAMLNAIIAFTLP